MRPRDHRRSKAGSQSGFHLLDRLHGTPLRVACFTMQKLFDRCDAA
jgi:hypothetical protein